MLRLSLIHISEPTRLRRISSYEMRRWYDNNRTLFMAFEYLKDADEEMQKSVAVKVLNFMRSEQAA